jgi:hypothetical protein
VSLRILLSLTNRASHRTNSIMNFVRTKFQIPLEGHYGCASEVAFVSASQVSLGLDSGRRVCNRAGLLHAVYQIVPNSAASAGHIQRCIHDGDVMEQQAAILAHRSGGAWVLRQRCAGESELLRVVSTRQIRV